MRYLIFILIIVAAWLLIPESAIRSFAENYISGDGEEAMDSLELAVIAIKASLSIIIAFIGNIFYAKAR